MGGRSDIRRLAKEGGPAHRDLDRQKAINGRDGSENGYTASRQDSMAKSGTAARRRLKRITLQVEGAAQDNGHVRLSEFIQRLHLLRMALVATERQMTGRDSATVYWRIVDLKHQSPATVVLEEVPLPAAVKANFGVPPVGDKLVERLQRINKSPRALPHDQQDLAILEAYKELGDLADKHIQKLVLKVGKSRVAIASSFTTNIEKIIGPDEMMQGSINGRIEALNIHNGLRFYVYPLVGPKKVVCDFPLAMKHRVIEAIDKYVHVSGRLRYKQWAKFPHAMDAETMEVLPEDADLPTLNDLRGMAPEATDGLSSEEFIDRVRDAW
jgi:hypothetical protein